MPYEDDAIVVTTGHIKTYINRARSLENARGFKVLNQVQVSQPETAAPAKILKDAA